MSFSHVWPHDGMRSHTQIMWLPHTHTHTLVSLLDLAYLDEVISGGESEGLIIKSHHIS